MSLRDILFGSDEELANAPVNEEAEKAGAEAAAKAMSDESSEDKKEGADLITTDMLVGEIIAKHPSTAQFLMDCGMECIFCPASQMESLGEACAVHGIDGDEICAALNERLEEYKD
jgi:hydroxylamine reductase